MAIYKGKEYSKQDLMRRVGNMKNIAEVRANTRNMGKPDGIKSFDVTCGDLSYSVMESRCLDILNLKYKNTPINFLSVVGPVQSGLADHEGRNFLRSISGGMLYTCGFSNVGGHYPSEEEGRNIFHGRLRFIPADNVASFEKWEGDDFVVGVSGEMRDNGLFFENNVLRRTISSTLGSKVITIDDEVENESFYTAPFMMMYHLNYGFPVLGPDCEMFIPTKGITPVNEESEKCLDEWNVITDPVDGKLENVYVHDLLHDAQGNCYVGAYNKELGLGMYSTFKYDVLPRLVEWRSMGSIEYCLGLMPSNGFASGRQMDIDKGVLKHIGPFETIKMGCTLTIIDGEEDLAEFKKKLEGCTL